MKHKNLTLMAVAMGIVLSLSACGTAGKTNSVASTESVATESTESVENSTEAFVPETELSTEESTDETEATESVAETVTETQEPVADEAVIDVKTVSNDKTDKTTDAGYTYSDVSKTMYAKSTVNVRSLPSTSGSRLGSLSKNQEVAVTGQCNETGWYRISYNNAEGFVSNKYLTDEPVAAAAGTKTAQAQAGTKTTSGTSTGDPIVDAAIAKYGPHIMVADDGTIYSSETFQELGRVDSTGSVSDYTKPAEPAKPVKPADGFDKGMAQQVWAYVNAERAAAGLNALAWDEDIYNFSCQRAQQIITDFSHNGNKSYYGENILINYDGTAESIHNQWKNSPVHYENYMKSAYATGACAVYIHDGYYYAVENFTRASSAKDAEYHASYTTREINGKTVELTGAEAKAFDEGNYWTASNGITVYITGEGTTSTPIPEGRTLEEAMAASNEYSATH